VRLEIFIFATAKWGYTRLRR